MIELQFEKVNRIVESYKNARRKEEDKIIVSHE